MNPNNKVLVVEDDPSMSSALRAGLEGEGFSVDVAQSGEAALEMFDIAMPDIVLLDVILPNISGIDVCRELRERQLRIPILMLSARTSELDTVVGLEVGADDYIAKPFRIRELVARMRAVIRRTSPPQTENTPEGVLQMGSLRLDMVRREVRISDALVSMPLKEFELLAILMANSGRVLTRDTLIKRIWGDGYVGDTKTLDVHIKRLRSKIEPDRSLPVNIQTVRGVGYKFAASSDTTAPV